MSQAEVDQLVSRLRTAGSDTTSIEVKSAAGGLPTSLTASLSALANLPGGGVIILGLDENLGFAAVPLSDPNALKQGLGAKARQFQPPVHLEIEDAEVDGLPIVVAHVRECDPSAKPCRVEASGTAYIRSWDGDYTMSELEEQAFLAQRQPPHFDRASVPEASVDDLDPSLIELWTQTVRETDQHGLGRFDGAELLRRAGVTDANGIPTKAGLLALGVQPQQFFPRFVVNVAGTAGRTDDSDARAINPTALSGSIPVMLDAALEWARRTFDRSVAAGPDGVVRDVHEYPLEAFRELVGNALVHRDLDLWSEGSAVEVRLDTDKLVVANPGGLYGVTVDRLGLEGTTSARNSRLLEICRFARSSGGSRVVETLATGIPRVLAAAHDAGLPRPEFYDTGIRFTAIMRRRPMSAPQPVQLTKTEQLVLAELGGTGLTVRELEDELGLSRPNIRKALRALREKQLAEQHGGRGQPTHYTRRP